MFQSVLSFCAAISSFYCAKYYHLHNKNNSHVFQPLQDILHHDRNLCWQKYRLIPDTISYAYVIVWFFFCQNKLIVFNTMCISQILRSVLCCITQLPPCNPTFYQSNSQKNKNILNGFHFDLIYSGHASLMVICLYTCDFSNLLFYLLLTIAMLNSYLIITTRCHYTIDVILAWLIVPLVFDKTKHLF